MFRLATERDVNKVSNIYEQIHSNEEKGLCTTGWVRGVYPVRETAESAVKALELYVLEEDGNIVAAAKINKEQMPEYAQIDWEIAAEEEQVLVLHTLVVSPAAARKGYGRKFVGFYNDLAKSLNCEVLRIDTNEKNTAARNMYAALGFREAGMVPCTFNGIEGVGLVCLERRVL